MCPAIHVFQALATTFHLINVVEMKEMKKAQVRLDATPVYTNPTCWSYCLAGLYTMIGPSVLVCHALVCCRWHCTVPDIASACKSLYLSLDVVGHDLLLSRQELSSSSLP